jgi:C-terminal processing protease CtpA/Prc
MNPAGIDEFGREYIIVEAAPGRLGLSLCQNERGHVQVCSMDSLQESGVLDQLNSMDRKRMQLLHSTIRIGDRLVEIEGEDVVHCSIQQIIVRLSKLSPRRRLLTFARYHASQFENKKFDVEKLVHIQAPPGPLGLILNEKINFGAFVEYIQASSAKLARHPKIHRGCQIIQINDIDVSTRTRDDIIQLLASLNNQKKQLMLYRATPSDCSNLFTMESQANDPPLGLIFDESIGSKCIIRSIAPLPDGSINTKNPFQIGDVLLGVNDQDISYLNRVEALNILRNASFPRTIYFYRASPNTEQIIPECHKVCIESGPISFSLDSKITAHAKVTGFSTQTDAQRQAFGHCKDFIINSYILSINQMDVFEYSLETISSFLQSLNHVPKQITFGNEKLLQNLLDQRRKQATIQVPKGPLGIHFNSVHPDKAIVAGFFPMADGKPGIIEKDGRIRIGNTLLSINGMNVSCLSLQQVSTLLKKMVDLPKELTFFLSHTSQRRQEEDTKRIHVRVLAGSLGIVLKRSLSNSVIVDKINQDSTKGSTKIHDHGGAIEGSELLAIDGVDVSYLELSEITQLLQTLATKEKILTFSTTTTAYLDMLSLKKKPALKEVIVNAASGVPLEGLKFESSYPNCAIVSAISTTSQLKNAKLLMGSRIIAIEDIDVQACSLNEIVQILKDLQGLNKKITFDLSPQTPVSIPGSPVTSLAFSPTIDTLQSAESNRLLYFSPAAFASTSHEATAGRIPEVPPIPSSSSPVVLGSMLIPPAQLTQTSSNSKLKVS